MKKCGFKYGLKGGFTLAETLIALTIIGICAAMTIPTLQNLNSTTSQTEISVLAKKTITNFSDATAQILMNHSKTRKMSGIYKLGSTTTICSDESCLFDLYGKYVNIAKEINKADIPENTNFAGTKFGVLSNGVIFGLTYDNTCKTTRDSMVSLPEGALTKGENLCGYIYYDANGKKGPNVDGKDRFTIPIFKTGIKLLSAKSSSTK